MATDTATSHVLNPPETANKVLRPHKKRGRKGNKIDVAFKDIPTEAVDFDEFAKKHDISTKVLRQVKRHDKYKTTGKVFIRKNKNTKKSTIWREPPAKS